MSASIDDLVRRIQLEYLMMPGLRLTAAQARRLLDLDGGNCQRVLSFLVARHFLTIASDGSYVRTPATPWFE